MLQARSLLTLMFRKLPPQDVAGPEEFLTEAVMLFVEYPDEVQRRATSEIVRRTDRPTIKQMRVVLDELHGPILRKAERDRAIRDAKLALPPPSRKRTPEEQARVDAQVAAARKQLGIPEGGLRPNGFPAGPRATEKPITDEGVST